MVTTKTKQRFDLSEDDLKTAVSDFIEKRFGPGGKLTVDVSIQNVTVGYGMNERDEKTLSVHTTREPDAPGPRQALQVSADEARAEELRLVTNYLHASGSPALRHAAQELSALKHREDVDPR